MTNFYYIGLKIILLQGKNTSFNGSELHFLSETDLIFNVHYFQAFRLVQVVSLVEVQGSVPVNLHNLVAHWEFYNPTQCLHRRLYRGEILCLTLEMAEGKSVNHSPHLTHLNFLRQEVGKIPQRQIQHQRGPIMVRFYIFCHLNINIKVKVLPKLRGYLRYRTRATIRRCIQKKIFWPSDYHIKST